MRRFQIESTAQFPSGSSLLPYFTLFLFLFSYFYNNMDRIGTVDRDGERQSVEPCLGASVFSDTFTSSTVFAAGLGLSMDSGKS